jgi:hypothetical protein
MPKIYCFINGGIPGLLDVIAMAEDGTYLAGHGSSNEGWARHDIGISSDWKHDRYREHYPDGYDLVWLDKPKGHPGLQEAYARNQAMKPEEPE